jgi:hypothetical protein
MAGMSKCLCVLCECRNEAEFRSDVCRLCRRGYHKPKALPPLTERELFAAYGDKRP